MPVTETVVTKLLISITFISFIFATSDNRHYKTRTYNASAPERLEPFLMKKKRKDGNIGDSFVLVIIIDYIFVVVLSYFRFIIKRL